MGILLLFGETKKPFFDHEGVKKPIGDWADSRLNKLSDNDLNRHNSVNKSGFGRDLSRWVGKKKVLPSNVISSAVVGKNKQHPAVYPTTIPEFFIKLLSPSDGLVVDPFAGSGTTGMAVLSLGRNCILIDNKEKYFRVCRERIKQETSFEIMELNQNANGSNGHGSSSAMQPMLFGTQGEY